MSKECLQLEAGPTPCFRAVDNTICSLSFCPAWEILKRKPHLSAWAALNSHCVMSEDYGRQRDFKEGIGEHTATIASLAANNRW